MSSDKDRAIATNNMYRKSPEIWTRLLR